MTTVGEAQRPKAVIVELEREDQSEAEVLAAIAELSRLLDTLGHEVVGVVRQKRPDHLPGIVLGQGKLKELAKLTGGSGVVPSGARRKPTKAQLRRAVEEAEEEEEEEEEPKAEVEGPAPVRAEIVVVDAELSPSQLRNLEQATDAEVIDRTGVIIQIFHRHAHTRAARLQVEIARLAYEAPRLREKPKSGDRQRGGGTGGKGDREIELDKRRVRDRMAELRKELEAVHAEDQSRRDRRAEQLRAALVGYTNAGKSSWMRALTGSEVLVADQLFATLGTTVRALSPETRPRILLSDTVGFIRELPHDLVACFRSTLAEASEADLLLLVVDASDPAFRAQLEVTRSVLAEVGAADRPVRLVLNKADRIDEAGRAALLAEHPGALLVSSRSPADVARVHREIVDFFDARMVDHTLVVPFARGALLPVIRERAKVVGERYDETGTILDLRLLPEDVARLERLLETR